MDDIQNNEQDFQEQDSYNESHDAEDQSADQFEHDVKVDELPEELKGEAEKLQKQFQGAYTRKTQDLAAKQKAFQAQMEALKKELEEQKRLNDEIFQDPTKYEAYRQIKGVKEPEKIDPSKFESVEDLLNYQEKREQMIIEQYEKKLQEIEGKTSNVVEQKFKEQETLNRWNRAEELKLAKDENYKKYQKLVENEIRSNEDIYKSMYSGNNEIQILDAALKKVMSFFSPEISKAKKEAEKEIKESIEIKKKASSLTSSFGNIKQNNNKGERIRTEDIRGDVIAAVNAKLGANPFTQR